MVLCKVAQERMKIEIGRLYINKTVKYLLPGLGYYGPTLKTKLNLVHKLAFGIHDNLIEGTHFAGQRNIFILLDRLVRPDLYENFMSWIKHQNYYVTDYSMMKDFKFDLQSEFKTVVGMTLDHFKSEVILKQYVTCQ